MKRNEYLAKAQEAYDSGRISAEVYDAMLMNADIFCDDEPSYAEIEYTSEQLESDPIAAEGARFADMPRREK